MQYKFLATWAKENQRQNLIFKKIEKFEDQYLISFKKQKMSLQICLSSECFCFFSESKSLPWEQKKELNQFNQNMVGARLSNIEISEADRIIVLEFNVTDIYNESSNLNLILELIPRYQNMIQTKNDVIIECLKKVSFAENRHRQILPGLAYTAPDSEYEIKKENVKFPLIVKEMKLYEASDTTGFREMNSAFESLYYNAIFQNRNDRLRNQKIGTINKSIKKKRKKIEKLILELEDASKEEIWKQQAELLKANFIQLKTGMKTIILKNYYEDDFPDIEIKLDMKKTAKQNIEFYFKKYRKARDGKKKINEQITLTELEIDRAEKEIFELEEMDFIPSSKIDSNKRKSNQKSGYKKLVINEDWVIYIGRTSKENDELTTRFAKPNDWWFHTRIFRGTHIILRNLKKKDLPDKMKFLCCRLAAYYSKAKKSTNVPVDFTEIRYVRKPRGAAAGYVTYKNQKTLYVDPLSIRDAANKLNKGKS
jgi:predicted ribosome quality control (RQC) complex YloA/Tae2 family protein